MRRQGRHLEHGRHHIDFQHFPNHFSIGTFQGRAGGHRRIQPQAVQGPEPLHQRQKPFHAAAIADIVKHGGGVGAQLGGGRFQPAGGAAGDDEPRPLLNETAGAGPANAAAGAGDE